MVIYIRTKKIFKKTYLFEKLYCNYHYTSSEQKQVPNFDKDKNVG